MVALIITTYNRPGYLNQCLESIKHLTDKPDIFIIADDYSDDWATMELLQNAIANNWICVRSKANNGIKENLLNGCETAISKGADTIINLDGDAIVQPNFISRLVELKTKFPYHIISGFNSRNEDNGKLRNPIISEHEGYALKKHGNGINMCFSREQYYNIITPSLEKQGNWDFNSTHDKPFVIAVPSLVEHIGLNSSMGHNDNPDVAYDYKHIKLPTVTLFGIDSRKPDGIKRAAEISMRNIEFGAVKIITEKLFDGHAGYSDFCINHMHKFIDTEHVLIIHADGYIQNWEAWDNDWLQYDYIGATWSYKDGMNVGNGGFSLRSKKLLDILAKANIEHVHPEDHHICRTYRESLEQYGIKYAPEEVANKFAIEAYGANVFPGANKYFGQFGFHGYHVTNLPNPIVK